jgi:hypothetical protein
MEMEGDMRAVESASDVSFLITRYKMARRKNEKDILNAVSKRLKELGVWEDRAIQHILGLTVAAE